MSGFSSTESNQRVSRCLSHTLGFPIDSAIIHVLPLAAILCMHLEV